MQNDPASPALPLDFGGPHPAAATAPDRGTAPLPVDEDSEGRARVRLSNPDAHLHGGWTVELVRALPDEDLAELLEHYSAVAGHLRVARTTLLSVEDRIAELNSLVEWQSQAVEQATLERERARATRSELDNRVRALEMEVEQLRLRGAAGEAAKSALGLAVGLLKEQVPDDLRVRELSLLAAQIGVGLSVPIRTGHLGPRPRGTDGSVSAVVLPFPGRRPTDTSEEADMPEEDE